MPTPQAAGNRRGAASWTALPCTPGRAHSARSALPQALPWAWLRAIRSPRRRRRVPRLWAAWGPLEVHTSRAAAAHSSVAVRSRRRPAGVPTSASGAMARLVRTGVRMKCRPAASARLTQPPVCSVGAQVVRPASRKGVSGMGEQQRRLGRRQQQHGLEPVSKRQPAAPAETIYSGSTSVRSGWLAGLLCPAVAAPGAARSAVRAAAQGCNWDQPAA